MIDLTNLAIKLFRLTVSDIIITPENAQEVILIKYESRNKKFTYYDAF